MLYPLNALSQVCPDSIMVVHFSRQVIMKIRSATSIDIQCNITNKLIFSTIAIGSLKIRKNNIATKQIVIKPASKKHLLNIST
jgi:hypothetical protein